MSDWVPVIVGTQEGLVRDSESSRLKLRVTDGVGSRDSTCLASLPEVVTVKSESSPSTLVAFLHIS